MGGGHVEVEGLLQESRRGIHQRSGHRAADIVHEDVDATELGGGHFCESGDGVEVGEVARHGDGPSPHRFDLGGHLIELGLGPSGKDDVRSALGEGQC